MVATNQDQDISAAASLLGRRCKGKKKNLSQAERMRRAELCQKLGYSNKGRKWSKKVENK